MERHIHKDQYNRADNSDIGPHKYAEWILTKVQKQCNARKIACLTNGARAIGHPQAKMNLDLNLTP